MTDKLIAQGRRYACYDNAHGFKVVRLRDSKTVTFYGDDSCMDFRDICDLDDCAESADEIADNGELLDAAGRKLMNQGAPA